MKNEKLAFYLELVKNCMTLSDLNKVNYLFANSETFTELSLNQVSMFDSAYIEQFDIINQ